MRGLRRTRRILVYGGAAAVAVAFALEGCSHPTGDLWTNPEDPPECQSEWRRLPKRLGGGLVGPGGFAVSGPITDVPEFHDCQKLLVVRPPVREGDSVQLAFGPLAAIFAAFKLDSLGRFYDTAVSAASDSIRAVALILTLGNLPYDPLRMRPGFSCLYLWRDVRQWSATILWVDTSTHRCDERVPVGSLPDAELRVERRVSKDSASAYPPVARWDWDSSTNQQYIGIACGSAWCEIGPRNFRSSESYLPMQGGTGSYVQRIKGWYDEQHLAIIDDNGNFVPGDAIGTVFPSDLEFSMGALESAATASQIDDRWIPTAYIAIDKESPYYRTTMNLRPVPPGSALDAMNVLSFCSGSRTHCGVPMPPTQSQVDELKASKAPRLAPLSGCDQGMSHAIWVRIRSAGAADGALDMFRCVTRRGHEGLTENIPATARWRWLLTDETVWRECTQGCCEVEVLG